MNVSRLKRGLTVLAVLALMVVLVAPVEAGGSKPAPPQSHAFGKTLSEWQELHLTWYLRTTYQGVDLPDHVGKVSFLPLPIGEPTGESPTIYVGNANVTLKPGAAFVLPILTFFGESYVEDVPDDTPLPSTIFTNAPVQVFMDGRPLINSDVEDMGKYYFGPTYFDQPISYAVPQPRGPGYTAEAAIWVQGIGFVYPPLSAGEHVLTLYSVFTDYGYGFFNTWHITVQR
jgi:hypothetical protein